MRRLAIAALALLLTACTTAPAPVEPTAAPAEYTVPWVIQQSWDVFHEQYPEVERPEVELVRVIPQAEYSVTMDECLDGEGYPEVEVTANGGLARESSADEQGYQFATYVCSARYPIDPLFYAPLTDEKVGLVYDYFVGVLQPCLAAEGQPSAPAPLSREDFVFAWEGVPLWSPYNDVDVAEIGPDEFERLLRACPELPSDDVLHGSP